jgi:hypothetical protein
MVASFSFNWALRGFTSVAGFPFNGALQGFASVVAFFFEGIPKWSVVGEGML